MASNDSDYNYELEEVLTEIQGEVVNEIGRGTFGKVYKVRYLFGDQQNDCTLKVIDIKETKENDLHIEEDEKKSLQLLQGLDNNYIIKYYGSWFKTNHIFIQMELCECTLRQLILSKDKLFDRILNSEPGDLEFFISITWLKEIVQGLMYLHKQEKPLIHRDLRPENIFMASYDADSICLKLGDFGLARIQDIASQSNSRGVGSPQYLAPEICADEDYRKYNVSADMYSLGMFITELFKFDYTEEPHDKRMVNIQAMVLTLLENKTSKRPTSEKLMDQIINAEIKDNQTILNDYANYTQGLERSENKYLYKYVSNKIEKICETL